MKNLVAAEWIKFASLRASWTRIAIAFVLNAAMLTLALVFFDRGVGEADPDTSVAARIGTVTSSIAIVAVVFAIVGVAVYTAEIKSRSIIPTIGAAPDRAELIGAKTILVGLVGLVGGAVIVVINAAVAIAVLDVKGFSLNLDDTDFVRVIFGSVAYIAIATLFGLGVGVIVSSATAAIAIVVLWPIAIESSLQAFLPDWIARFLPFEAGQALFAVPARDDLPPWEGGGVFLAWAGILLLTGWALFNRRDLGAS